MQSSGGLGLILYGISCVVVSFLFVPSLIGVIIVFQCIGTIIYFIRYDDPFGKFIASPVLGYGGHDYGPYVGTAGYRSQILTGYDSF